MDWPRGERGDAGHVVKQRAESLSQLPYTDSLWVTTFCCHISHHSFSYCRVHNYSPTDPVRISALVFLSLSHPVHLWVSLSSTSFLIRLPKVLLSSPNPKWLLPECVSFPLALIMALPRVCLLRCSLQLPLWPNTPRHCVTAAAWLLLVPPILPPSASLFNQPRRWPTAPPILSRPSRFRLNSQPFPDLSSLLSPKSPHHHHHSNRPLPDPFFLSPSPFLFLLVITRLSPHL